MDHRFARMLGCLLVLGSSLLSTSTLRAADDEPRFRSHVVVSQQVDASEAGRSILRKGGNAIDAAIATAFALAVTHPAAGNLGGGGFLVAWLPADKRMITIDFREVAPAASTRRMYLDAGGGLVPGHRAGAKAAGVPGTVRGLGEAHRKYGKTPWAELVAPAVALARDGFTISETLARSLNGQLFAPGAVEVAGVPEDLGPRSDRMASFPSSVSAYRRADGRPWRAGDRLVQPDLAATLARIAEGGADEFYTGRTADLISNYCAAEGGLITKADLAAYRAVERIPVHGRYRGFDVYGMGPPASGGILILEMLGMLEPFELRKAGPDSPETIHRVAEAMRRAFAVRAESIADPDVVAVPTAELVSPAKISKMREGIGPRATPSETLVPFRVERAEGPNTTHLSTLDRDGGAVALTYTLEEGYGSKAVVKGAGFLLNNEMGDFNLIPGWTDTRGRIGTEPNLIAPGKRMLSSQSPTIVMREGKVRIVTGSPGGRTIPNTTLWVLLGLLEFERTPREAVDAPRIHHQWFPDMLDLEGDGRPASVLDDLRSRGHRVRTGRIQGDAHTIVVDAEGVIHGVADRRRKTSTAAGD